MKAKDSAIHIRVSQDDKEKIKDSGLKYSDVFYYGLHGILRDTEKERNMLLRNIANNINQITRHFNGTNELPEIKELKEILKEIKKIKEL